MSNQKQIGLSFMMYAQDYDETLPDGNVQAATGNNNGDPANPRPAGGYAIGRGWAGEVYPQIKNAGVFKCPSDTTEGTAPNVPVSYSFNRNIAGMPLAQMNKPATTVLLCEIAGNTANVSQAGGLDLDSSSSTGGDAAGRGYLTPTTLTYATGALGFPVRPYQTVYGKGRHSDGSNFIIADGHCKWLKGNMVSNAISATAPGNAQTNTRAAGTEVSGLGLTFSNL